jgi:hypothetical protein
LIYAATETVDGLVKGKFYRFVSKAFNAEGLSSEFSSYGYIAFGAVPVTLEAPERINSTETSITMKWSAPTSADLKVTGYILSRDDGHYSDLAPIYFGKGRPDVLQFTSSNLTQGLPYRFSVQAINQNGYSLMSPYQTVYSCRLPIDLQTPFYVWSSSTMIKVGWTKPAYNGGCAILGYQVFYREFGSSNEIEVDDVPTSSPNLNKHTVALGSANTGKIYQFKVRARNQAGFVDSNYVSVALASLPKKPTEEPETI